LVAAVGFGGNKVVAVVGELEGGKECQSTEKVVRKDRVISRKALKGLKQI